jgi:spermidine/putrescine transport system ATP-binding protein
MWQTVRDNQGNVTTTRSADVELQGAFKFFNQEPAVHGIDLEVKQGEFFSILGPSGCGKTTTLRMIAGFESVDAGKLFIRGESMTNVPPYKRPVNTVFQSYALFNHLNVWDNIAFGLRLKKLPKSKIQTLVKDALAQVKMEGFQNRFPVQLSGGQQQRVALARALVNRPSVLLLDEPLGALDLKLRKEMQLELSNLHRELGLTFVMVTHDQEEALSLSNRIAVMNKGKIEQIGTPSEIYEQPRTAFVADFIGDTNLFTGQIVDIDANNLQVLTNQQLKINIARKEFSPTEKLQSVTVCVRPEKIQLSLYKPNVQMNCFEGRLINVMYLGTRVNYVVEIAPATRITVMQPNIAGIIPNPDTPIYAWWSEADCIAISE